MITATQMDITDIMADPDFQGVYPLKRVRFSMDSGRLIPSIIEDKNIQCIITPYLYTQRKNNGLLFETINGKVACYSKENIYGMAVDDVTAESIIDFIKYNGVWYQCVEIEPWNNHGFIYAILSQYETQPIFQEVEDALYPG